MPRWERRWLAHLLDTRIQSCLWHSPQTANASSQALPIGRFVCGMPQPERRWQAHLLDTRIRSCLWHSLQMASASSQARAIEPFACGTPRRERRRQRSVAFSPDDLRIVSGSDDGTIRVWNATTRETAAGPFAGHRDWIESVALSPDDQRITSSERGSIRILNATTGNTVTTRHPDFTDHSIINDEGWICGSNGELLMWIPLIHRTHLHRPSNIWVAGKHETCMDLSTFVHGRSWTTCTNA